MMIRILALTKLGIMLSGCYMLPMAFIGPATSGFTTASILQSGITTGASFVVKKSTGKSIGEHVFSSITEEILQQAYFPKKDESLINSKEEYLP